MPSSWRVLHVFLRCKWNATSHSPLIGQLQFKQFFTGTEMSFGKAACEVHVVGCQRVWTPRQYHKIMLLVESITQQSTWICVLSLDWLAGVRSISWWFADCTLRTLTSGPEWLLRLTCSWFKPGRKADLKLMYANNFSLMKTTLRLMQSFTCYRRVAEFA